MGEISRFLGTDHRSVDRRIVALEEAARIEDWPAATVAAAAFREATVRHFAMEEDVLFPAVEAANPAAAGPTSIMRMEHDQVRAILDQIDDAVSDRDRKRSLGLVDSLMVLVQQHNMKEEQILYPMADQAIADGAALVERMQAAED